jgi:hypothetical protein
MSYPLPSYADPLKKIRSAPSGAPVFRLAQVPTVLGRVKRWVLAVLTMLAREERAARGSVRLRSRRQEAALLTRPALPWSSESVGTKGVPQKFDAACGASNKGLGAASKASKQASKASKRQRCK